MGYILLTQYHSNVFWFHCCCWEVIWQFNSQCYIENVPFVSLRSFKSFFFVSKYWFGPNVSFTPSFWVQLYTLNILNTSISSLISCLILYIFLSFCCLCYNMIVFSDSSSSLLILFSALFNVPFTEFLTAITVFFTFKI